MASMTYLVALAGILLALLGLTGLISPEFVVGRLRGRTVTPRMRAFAVGVRLILGAILIAAANYTAFPLTILALGGLIFAAGIALIFVGEELLNAILYWALGMPLPVLRIAFAGALLAGSFLLYAVSA